MPLTLISQAFTEGAPIPQRYTCEGDDISPPLRWTGAPNEARSFAIVCSDPDAPGGTWYHWGIYSIPGTTGDLHEGYPTDPQVGTTRQTVTDFKRPGYGGPCPPPGHGTHRYHFHLMALDVETLSLDPSADCRDLEQAVARHILAETVLTGTYSR